MNTRDELRDLIDTLNEDTAAEALSLVRVLVAERETEQRVEAAPPDRDIDEKTAAILAAAKPITADDPLWNRVGIGDSGPHGPTDVARNKHKYLAEAYEDRHES
ncbi:MAG: hypothetical protein ACRDJH_21985 [Thermomicrobiales bacterium]